MSIFLFITSFSSICKGPSILIDTGAIGALPCLQPPPQHLERGINPGTLGRHPVERNAPPGAWFSVSGVRAGGEEVQPRSAGPSPWAVQPVCTTGAGALSPVDCAHPYPNACQHDPKSTVVVFFSFEEPDLKLLLWGFLSALTNLD